VKIIFLTHSSDQGHRFRVEQYFPFLHAEGIEPKWQPVEGSLGTRFALYNSLRGYDVVCIQRKLFSPVEFFYLRRRARKVLFDIDDAVMYRSSGAARPHSFSRRLKFGTMVRGSDLVTAGNRFLKAEVLKVDPKKRVVLIPTSIDTSVYPKKKAVSEGRPPVLGWIGTKGNLRFLKELEPVFEEIGRRFPGVSLKIVSNDFYDSTSLPVIKKEWRLEEENEDLVSFDIGLMPLRNDLWSNGKCGLKIVQYLSVGVPVVCTPVGINCDIVTEGENGFWARDREEWVQRLAMLIQDPDLRRCMGAKGIETVERGYSLQVTSGTLIGVLREIA
jgi:glycosyltransferase involved in cell wall biosynthesis